MRYVPVYTSLALISAVAPAAAQPVDGSYYHGHMDGWAMGLFGLGMMVFFWGGLAVLIVLAVRWLGDQNGGFNPKRRTDPLDILKERLARGEVDLEDYEARRKHLEG